MPALGALVRAQDRSGPPVNMCSHTRFSAALSSHPTDSAPRRAAKETGLLVSEMVSVTCSREMNLPCQGLTPLPAPLGVGGPDVFAIGWLL